MNKISLIDIGDINSTDINSQYFETIKEYTDDNHLIRRLIKHRPSGELYFYECKEETDWTTGNDPQYRTYIPVADETESDEINKLDIYKIHTLTPRLIHDTEKNNEVTIRWIK